MDVTKPLPKTTNCEHISLKPTYHPAQNLTSAIKKAARRPLAPTNIYAPIQRSMNVRAAPPLTAFSTTSFTERRYTCIHPTCLPGPDSEPMYFSKWTALQHHMRTVHQPTCTHPSCNGRTFSSQKGLSAHLKLHEERDLEMKMRDATIPNPSDDDEDDLPLKKRRGGEIGRDWKCDKEGCDRDFKSASLYMWNKYHLSHHLPHRKAL